MMEKEENHARTKGARGYNARADVRALRASVESINDRDELRTLHSQLCQLLIEIRDKMRGRTAR